MVLNRFLCTDKGHMHVGIVFFFFFGGGGGGGHLQSFVEIKANISSFTVHLPSI